jgi:hypothetical protein
VTDELILEEYRVKKAMKGRYKDWAMLFITTGYKRPSTNSNALPDNCMVVSDGNFAAFFGPTFTERSYFSRK